MQTLSELKKKNSEKKIKTLKGTISILRVNVTTQRSMNLFGTTVTLQVPLSRVESA